MKRYFIFTYLLFWLLIGLTGFLISLDVPVVIQNIAKNVAAWAPTFVILLMFKRLYPNTKLRDYLKQNFKGKAKTKYFFVTLVLQAAVLVAAVLAYTVFNKLKLDSITFISVSALVPAFIMCVTSGAIGEELGWRAYALNAYQKKYSPLKSAIFVGLIWAFWHLPLWIASGYAGLELLYYSLSFTLGIVSLSIVITFFYNKGRNILIAMWMHFLFNFLLQLVIIDLLQLIIYISVGYLILAIILIVTHKQEFYESYEKSMYHWSIR